MEEETIDASPKTEPEQGVSIAERAGQIAAVMLLLALLAGTVFLVIGIYPDKLPQKVNPGFVDTIFASKIVVATARIALLFVAGYAIISVVGLIVRGQFLTRVGPFQVSESVQRLDQEAEGLRRELADAQETIDLLEGRLLSSDLALKETQTYLDAALDALGMIDDPEEEPE